MWSTPNIVSDSDDNTSAGDTDTLTFRISIFPAKAPTPQVRASYDQLVLSWNRPADSGISGWQLSVDGGAWSDVAPAGTATLSYMVNGLDDYSRYYEFGIRAYAESEATTVYGHESETAGNYPLRPPSFGGATMDDQSWVVGESVDAALPKVLGGNGSMSYGLLPLPSGMGLSSGVGAKSLKGTPDTSQPAKEHEYEVSDWNHDQTVFYRDRIAFTIAIAPAQAPTPNVSAGFDQATLSLEKPSDSGISGWQLSVDGGAWRDIVPAGTETLEHTVGGLAGGSEYAFRIRARTGDAADAVYGDSSESVSATTCSSSDLLCTVMTAGSRRDDLGNGLIIDYVGFSNSVFGTYGEMTSDNFEYNEGCA